MLIITRQEICNKKYAYVFIGKEQIIKHNLDKLHLCVN